MRNKKKSGKSKERFVQPALGSDFGKDEPFLPTSPDMVKRKPSKRKRRFSDFVEDDERGPTVAPYSEARNSFYEDLQAQQDAIKYVLGDDSEDSVKSMEMARKIFQKTAADITIVQKGDDGTESTADAENLVDAQDEGATGLEAGRVFGPPRNVDLYQIYARINPRILRHFVSRAFIGYPACTVLMQHEVIGLCCAMPAEDAIASGYRLRCVSEAHHEDDEHLQKEMRWLEEMAHVIEDSDLEADCIKYGTYKRGFGIGIAIPVCQLKEGHTFEEEYDPSFIEPHSFRSFNIVDPSRIVWDFEPNEMYNPLSEWYQKPKWARIVSTGAGTDLVGYQNRIHRSWLITSNFREVGEDLLATYQFGGQPLSQIIYERVFCADKLANEIVALAASKRTVVMEQNVSKMLANPAKANRFFERWNHYRNNSSIAMVEPNSRIQQLETSLADLQPLSAQQYQYCAAFSGIPMTKLFKNVPSGLQATGQYEVEDYEQTCKPIRKDYERLINRFLEMYIASEYGNERDDLKLRVVFNDFVSPKAQEVTQIASSEMSLCCQGIQHGLVTVTEARSILRANRHKSFSMLASNTPELLKKLEEMKDPEKQQEMQMKQQMAMAGGENPGGGMPGGVPGGENPGGQQQQPQENPNFTQNKGAFENAVAKLKEKIQGGVPASAETGEGQHAPESQQGNADSQASQSEGAAGPFSAALSGLQNVQPSPQPEPSEENR